MKLALSLTFAFMFAISVTFCLTLMLLRASPGGNHSDEHIHHHYIHLDESTSHNNRSPRHYKLMKMPVLLSNDSIELESEQKIQHYQHTSQEENLLEEQQTNVSAQVKNDSSPDQDTKKTENVTWTLELLDDNFYNLTSEEDSEGNLTAVLRIDQQDLENFTIVHGNCSHCMEEYDNATSFKYLGCMCALFTTEHPSKNDVSVSSKIFQNVSCHEDVPSEEACNALCISMVDSYNELRNDMICEFIAHASNMTVYLQSKLCDVDSQWTYTGVSSPTPICCHMGREIQC
nr:uncharacterized protein LOC111510892 [Leptinotarsa decemlineata]